MSRSVMIPTTRGQALPPVVTMTAPTCLSFISVATSASVALVETQIAGRVQTTPTFTAKFSGLELDLNKCISTGFSRRAYAYQYG
jgi:hypothetical protein